MKKNIENFDTFIVEQKVWFEENLDWPPESPDNQYHLNK